LGSCTKDYFYTSWEFNFHYYAAEVLQESIIETCTLARWTEPDCEPAIIAISFGRTYAHCNDGQLVLKDNALRFKKCKPTSVFSEFPEEIKETTNNLENLVLYYNTVTGTFADMNAISTSVTKTWGTLQHSHRTIITDLEKSINGFSQKRSGQTGTRTSGNSPSYVAGGARAWVKEARADLDAARRELQTEANKIRAEARQAAKKAGKKK
jgi:hypothetical protein